MEVKDKKIVVVGLARTGVAVARFMAERGAQVVVTDMKSAEALAAYVTKLEGLPVNFELGGHDLETFRSADLVVVSPGVPMNVEPLKVAIEAGRPVISEIELAARFITAPMVAITGTNGKTTTTTLIGEIFQGAGFRTFVGGNIGNPLIDLAISGDEVDRVVAEISSFQLEGIESFCPHVSILLNITEDHLDRYASYQEYIEAKARIFENQASENFAILNIDDPLVAQYADKIAAQVIPFSREKELGEGIFSRDGFLTFRWQGREERFDLSQCLLRGVHNEENMMAALAATLVSGCSGDAAREVLKTFSGLHHRMELVATVKGVPYFNDSKGTNVGSVVRSLESFSENITLIAGGKDKGGSYLPLADLVRARVAHLVLLGEAKVKMNEELGPLTDTVLVDSLEEAVSVASRITSPGGVVLFSPACSSFDMFRNYEERGNRFAEAVKKLPGAENA